MVEKLTLNREGDWQSRLSEYIGSVRDGGLQFQYGKHDCCTFAAGAVEAITGVDPIPEFRGKYQTEIGSLKALKKLGAGNLEATLDAKFPAQGIAHAQRGDLVFCEGNLGVVMGRWAWFLSDDSLERIALQDCSRAWKVG